MKHTKESIIKDLKEEFETLSTEEWEECGDVNYQEYGGVLYRKGSDQIEVQFYRGYDDIPKEVPDRLDTWVDLETLIDGIDDIWNFADLENCGLSIGWAIQSLDAYGGFLSQESGWYFSEERILKPKSEGEEI